MNEQDKALAKTMIAEAAKILADIPDPKIRRIVIDPNWTVGTMMRSVWIEFENGDSINVDFYTRKALS